MHESLEMNEENFDFSETDEYLSKSIIPMKPINNK